jgi:SPP1 gp7 family putative phage head morphogenesis protein
VAQLEKATREIIFPQIELFSRQDADDITRVVGGLEIAVGRIFTREAAVVRARTAGTAVAKHHGTQFRRVLKRVTKLDVIGTEKGVADQVDFFIGENARLITSIGERHVTEIEKLLRKSAEEGFRGEVLRDKLQERFVISRNRAALIARDQVLTLNAQINRTRQVNVGITHYFWSTSGDEKVRGLEPGDTMDHAILDGTRQAWDSPPITSNDGGRAHPGQDVNCRCNAIPDTASLLS